MEINYKMGDLYNLRPTFWKAHMKKVTTPEEKLDVVYTLAGILIEEFAENPKRMGEQVRISRSVVTASTGLVCGYRLTENWFKCAIVQMIMTGSTIATPESAEEGIRKLNKVWNSRGWNDLEECMNPKYSGFNILHPFDYHHSNHPETGEMIFETVFIILEPDTRYPIGSEWVSNSGGVYHVTLETEKAVWFIPYDGSTKACAFPKKTLRNWTRLV